KIENWMLWMMVNAIYIVIYYQKGLMLYMVLFTAYGILSVMGWRTWRRTMVQQNLMMQTQEA
ncbi:MAG: nicotinamide mononucleotide transporter, partial [Chitinophagaceae bacterium]|nr:nicotinamide mononucleotide transporter [Chitinophagaceae bacterium]